MKSIAFSLVLFSVPVFGGDENMPKASIGVYVQFEHPASDSVRSVLQIEVESILAPLGFNIHWREASAGGEVWADLALVTFQGRCDPQDTVYPTFVPGALGWIHITDGTIQPFAFIDCDRIGALLQGIPARNRDRLFERAIARVVVHELYHIFVRTDAHAGSGVGKPEFTARDLLSDRFAFHPAQARALRISSVEDRLQFQAGR